jgi:hypothetical protein
MAVEFMYAHDPSRMWPHHEKHLREYLTTILYGHAPEITVYQAEGDLYARRHEGWIERRVRTHGYAGVSTDEHLAKVWAEIVVEMAGDLQSHDALEIVYVRRFDVPLRSVGGHPSTVMTCFELVYDLPPKRRCKPQGSVDEYDLDVSSSPESAADGVAQDLNRGVMYKRSRPWATDGQ